MKSIALYHRIDLWQILRYLFSGGAAFVLDFALLYVFRGWFGLAAWLSAALAFVISTVFAYFMQKLFTFNQTRDLGKSALRYLVLLVFNTTMAALIVQAFDTWFGLYLVGKIVAGAATVAWNYPLMRAWVYQSRPTAHRLER